MDRSLWHVCISVAPLHTTYIHNKCYIYIYVYTIICVYNNIYVIIADIFGEMSYSSGLLSVLHRTELGGN